MSNHSATDRTRDAVDSLIPMLDVVDAMPGAAELRARSYELLDLTPGTLVVDVGCGAGRAVAEMAERGVNAVGVDVSEQMVAVARRRWPGMASAWAPPTSCRWLKVR